MRVENEKREMTFGDLETGDCFEYGYEFFMKTTSVGEGEFKRNTVYLKSGVMTWFCDTVKVRCNNAKIVVD